MNAAHQNFLTSQQTIDTFNAENPKIKLAHNKFSDFTMAELKMNLGFRERTSQIALAPLRSGYP